MYCSYRSPQFSSQFGGGRPVTPAPGNAALLSEHTPTPLSAFLTWPQSSGSPLLSACVYIKALASVAQASTSSWYCPGWESIVSDGFYSNPDSRRARLDPRNDRILRRIWRVLPGRNVPAPLACSWPAAGLDDYPELVSCFLSLPWN